MQADPVPAKGRTGLVIRGFAGPPRAIAVGAAMLCWPMREDVRRILEQPFHFLNRGAKVHAYRSADGRTVLKTLNAPADVARWFADDGRPLDGPAWDLGDDALAAAEAMLERTLDSYRMSAAEMWQDTGLVWQQLEPAGSGPMAPLGGGASLDTGNAPFILQHYADLVRHRIDASECNGDQGSSRTVLDDVIGLIASIWRKGITEDSFNFHNNYGYAQGRMIQVDVGEFHKSAEMVREQLRSPKVLRRKSQAWLRRKYPALADYFEAQVRLRLNEQAFGPD